MSLAEDATPCTVCGEPVLWGTRHPICGQRVMAAEALDLDQLKRIVRAKEAALGVTPAQETIEQCLARERREFYKARPASGVPGTFKNQGEKP